MPSDDAAVVAAVADLVRVYDKLWSALDFAGLLNLWVRADPSPSYVGDEYATPLIGSDELERHWARLASRLRSASVASTVHDCDVIDGTVVRVLLLSRWRLIGRETDGERSGASWVTWMLVRRGERFHIFHQMESQIYLAE